MTRIVLLAAVILAAIPGHAVSQPFQPEDDSREVHLTNTSLPSDDQVQKAGQETVEGKVALEKRLKQKGIESIIKDMQQTRSELRAQIETQRQLVIKLEKDIARIIDYMEEQRRSQSASADRNSVTSPEIRQTTDSANVSATISEKIEPDPEEGWIRNEATGETISLQHGKVSIADRGGRPIDRPTEMLTTTGVDTPGAPLQVGNLDVTFSPRVSRQVKMAFLHYPAAPAEPVRQNGLYTGTTNQKVPGATPAPQLAVAARTNNRGEVPKIKVRNPSPPHSTSSANNHRYSRPLEPVHITKAGSGKRKLHPAIISNQAVPFAKGIPEAIGQWHNQSKAEKITGFNLKLKPAKTEPAVKAKEKVAILKLHEGNGIPEIGNNSKGEGPSVLYSLEG